MRLRAASFAIATALMACQAWAGQQPSPEEKVKLDQARTLIGSYYGDSTVLQRAAVLVTEVLKKNPQSAGAYVEAARITIKSGQIVSQEFAPGAKDAYRALVAKALELEPDNVQALSLRAEIYLLSGVHEEALAVIQRGQQLAPANPWLKLNLAAYYLAAKNTDKYAETLETVITPECQIDAEYRRACVVALMKQMALFSHPENKDLLRTLAKSALALKNPKDAWTLGDMALYFADSDLLDESIDYSKQALRVMNYGVARLNLAAVLYAKAAMLQKEGKDPLELLREADSLGVPEERVLEWYKRGKSAVRARAPDVLRLFESRASGRLGPAPPAAKRERI